MNISRVDVYDNYAVQTNGSTISLLKDRDFVCGKKICNGSYYINRVNTIPEQSSYRYVYNDNNQLLYEGSLNNNNQFEGYGVLYSYSYGKQMKEYQGNWREGVKHGIGQNFLANNLFIKVRYENGELKEELKTDSIKESFKDFDNNNSNYSYVEMYQEKENSDPLIVFSGFVDKNYNYYYGITYYQTDENNPQYKGFFLNGKYTGIGTFYSNSLLSFTGTFVDGIPKHGKILYENAIIYEGTVNEKYQMHGSGTMYTFKSLQDLQHGIIRYHGEFMNNKCNGFGKLYSITGELTYCGYFRNNLFDGKGVYFKYDGNKIQAIGLTQRFSHEEVLKWAQNCNKESFDSVKDIQNCWEKSDLKNGSYLFVNGEENILTYSDGKMYLTTQDDHYQYMRMIQKSDNGIDIGIMKIEYVGQIKRIHQDGYDLCTEYEDSQFVAFYTNNDEKIFEGKCKDFIPNGHGIYFDNGRRRKIEGEWQNGYLSKGEQVQINYNGDCHWRFSGEFTKPIYFFDKQQTEVSGKGEIYEIKNDRTILIYSGSVINGEYHGKGKQYTGELHQHHDVWMGHLVCEGEFERNHPYQYIIRDITKTKGLFNSYVKKPIPIHTQSHLEVAYYENEETGAKEYDHYTFIEGNEESGWFIKDNHVRFGKQVNGKWEGDVYSYDCDLKKLVYYLENPRFPIEQPPGVLKWKRIYRTGTYIGDGKYYDNETVYIIKNNQGSINNQTTKYTGGLKEIEENNDYHCICEGKGIMTIDSITYDGYWKNGQLEGDAIIYYSKTDYMEVFYNNTRCITKQHCINDMKFVFNENTVKYFKGNELVYYGCYYKTKQPFVDQNSPFYSVPYIPHGQGTLYSEVRYEGYFEHGKRKGQGKEIHTNMEVSGIFDDTKCEGCIIHNKEEVFVGTIESGRPIFGQFKKIFYNVRCFTEKIKVDEPTLSVTLYNQDKQKIYSGNVAINQDTWTLYVNGNGEYFSGGKIYRGQWKNDKLVGEYIIELNKNEYKSCSKENGREIVHKHIINDMKYDFHNEKVTIYKDEKLVYEGGYVERKPTKKSENWFKAYQYIPDGKGVYYDTSLTYKGSFNEGMFYGEGELFMNDIVIHGKFTNYDCQGTVKRNNTLLFNGSIQQFKPIEGMICIEIEGTQYTSNKVKISQLSKKKVQFSHNNLKIEKWVVFDDKEWSFIWSDEPQNTHSSFISGITSYFGYYFVVC